MDADTARKVMRSFLVVRVIRGSLILVLLAIALLAVEVRHWPTGVVVAIVIAMLLQLGWLGGSWRRYARSGSDQRPRGLR